MRRLLIPLLVLAAFLAAVPSAEAGFYSRCRGIVDAGPTGMDPADVKGLRKHNVSCPRARRVARKWLSPTTPLDANGNRVFGKWVCLDGIGKVNGVNRTRVLCKAVGNQRVRFYLG